METSNKYQQWATTQVRDVPQEEMQAIVNEFLHQAEINMGSQMDLDGKEMVTYLARKNYAFIPTAYIASAITRGSLGEFGPGRLVPRTVRGWMDQAVEEYNRHSRSEKLAANPDYGTPLNLKKFPAGQAILKKMDWLEGKKITSPEWDRISLKRLAEDLQAGNHYEPDYYLNF